MFVNHADVTRHLRRLMVEFHTRGLGPAPVEDGDTFGACLDELATQQLVTTLGYLAKGLPVYDVVFDIDGSFDVSPA